MLKTTQSEASKHILHLNHKPHADSLELVKIFAKMLLANSEISLILPGHGDKIRVVSSPNVVNASSSFRGEENIYEYYRVAGVHLSQMKSIVYRGKADLVSHEIENLRMFRYTAEIGAQNIVFEESAGLLDTHGWINEEAFLENADFFQGSEYVILGFHLIDCVEYAVRSIALRRAAHAAGSIFHILLSLSEPYFKDINTVIAEYRKRFDNGIDIFGREKKEYSVSRYIFTHNGNRVVAAGEDARAPITVINFWDNCYLLAGEAGKASAAGWNEKRNSSPIGEG